MGILQIVENPEKKQWPSLLRRPALQSENLDNTVREILEGIKKGGDEALNSYSLQFEQSAISDRLAGEKEFEAAENKLGEKLKTAIRLAKKNIEAFHSNQLAPEPGVEVMAGIRCWRKSVAIEKVGLYIPGGTAPLFSTLLMLGVPARLAGCEEIIVCTPPQPDGSIHPTILFAAALLGIRKLIKAGGAQAIAAMAYGTETIPKVYKIFGPGNQYVTHAKKIIQQEGIAIDMPAGPSELAVYADESAIPEFVAADLLSQCEHGTDSQVILVTTSRGFADAVNAALELQIERLPRKSIARKSLENSKIFLLKDPGVSLDLLNDYAPEHLILACRDPEIYSAGVRNAGSVFLGNYAPESAGDYASGTNHTLPTNGFARAYSGVSMDSFVKKISFQQLTRNGLQSISNTVTEMARAEGLHAHAAAVEIRFSTPVADF
jgi:histidinol dehydrogenase